MSDSLSDRIANVMCDTAEAMCESWDRTGVPPWKGECDFGPIADAILAMPGVAVVELPEPECVTDNTAGWAGWTWAVNRNVGVVIVDIDSGGCAVSPDQARNLAAALLAAADYAERDQ